MSMLQIHAFDISKQMPGENVSSVIHHEIPV